MASHFFDAIFFDMDGLTINSEPQWLEAEIELTAPTDPAHSFLSSSLVKELAKYNGDISKMVPPSVQEALAKKVAG